MPTELPLTNPKRDLFAELYVVGLFADTGWGVYFPKRDQGFVWKKKESGTFYPEREVCTRGDSNSHGFLHTHLKRARLPFRHECREAHHRPCDGFVTEI